MLKLIGKIIINNKNTKLLVIHSKKLSERVIQNKNKIFMKNYKDGLIVNPKGDIHVTIAAKKRLQIAITKLIKEKKIHVKFKEIPIYLKEKRWGINKEDILSRGVGSPLCDIVPSNLVKKNAAVRINNERFYLDISSKKLYEIVKKNIVKCLFNRINDSIIIINSKELESRRLTPHSQKRVQIAIPKELLKKDEIIKILERGWLPINIELNLKSFNLEVKDFYSIREEKELVEYLTKRDTEIKIKEPSDPYDILIKNKETAIEIHNSSPSYGDLVTRHKIKPGMIRLRILEADFLTKMNELSKFFLVFNEKWSEGKYIKELINKSNGRVKVIFTDFKDKWYEKIGNKILNEI